jgi:ketosteroid isomerase-like protein
VSQENVELVRKGYSAEGRVDLGRFAEFFEPDAELIFPEAYPDTEARYVGLDGFRRAMQRMDEIWEDLRFEAERFLDAGQSVVVFVTTSGTARISRAALAARVAHVYDLRDGRLVRLRIFLDRQDALKAVGLEE